MSVLLDALRAGDDAAAEQLYATIYDELRRLARVIRRGNGAPATINTTALVHEAYLHLRPGDGLDVQNKRHFFRLAARAMRQVLCRAARHRTALKRGGNAETVAFDDRFLGAEVPLALLLTVDDALSDLRAMHPRQADIVECRFYAGLSVEETADVLGVSPSTVKRDWRAAKAWLQSRLRAAD